MQEIKQTPLTTRCGETQAGQLLCCSILLWILLPLPLLLGRLPLRCQCLAQPPVPRPPVGVAAGFTAVPNRPAGAALFAALTLARGWPAPGRQVGAAQVGAAAGGRNASQLQPHSRLLLGPLKMLLQQGSQRNSWRQLLPQLGIERLDDVSLQAAVHAST